MITAGANGALIVTGNDKTIPPSSGWLTLLRQATRSLAGFPRIAEKIA
jgi:hypothetical protein